MTRTHRLACLIVLILSGCSLSAPPPERGASPLLTAPAEVDASLSFELPSRRPSVAAGAAIYADKCADCHGASGQGDGVHAEGVRQQVGVLPANLIDPNVAGAATAGHWFHVISAGRLDQLMPPFAESLSVDQRWDVIAYVWSLSMSQDSIAMGRSIYAERCAACHGDAGQGNGPQAEAITIDFSQIGAYQSVASGEWQTALSAAHVPSFAGKLDSAEGQALIGYVRAFAYDQAAAVLTATPVSEPTAIAHPMDESTRGLTVRGALANGTAGGATPSGLPVTLSVTRVDSSTPTITQTARADTAGRFSFSGVDARAGDRLSIVADYGRVRYFGSPVSVKPAQPAIDLPLTVYETTTDVSALHVETLHLIVSPLADRAQIDEIYIITNRGDRVVANTNGPAFRVGLPPGAMNVRVLNELPPEIVQIDPGGIAFFEAVFPGSGSVQLVVNYELPLSGGSLSLERPALVPIDAVSLMLGLTDDPLNLNNPTFTPQGTRQVNGVTFNAYTGAGLALGQQLGITLARPLALDFKWLASIALLCLGIGAVGLGLWRRRARLSPALRAEDESMEHLINRIAALDDAFAAGEIETAKYRQLRKRLKVRLAQLAQPQTQAIDHLHNVN